MNAFAVKFFPQVLKEHPTNTTHINTITKMEKNEKTFETSLLEKIQKNEKEPKNFKNKTTNHQDKEEIKEITEKISKLKEKLEKSKIQMNKEEYELLKKIFKEIEYLLSSYTKTENPKTFIQKPQQISSSSPQTKSFLLTFINQLLTEIEYILDKNLKNVSKNEFSFALKNFSQLLQKLKDKEEGEIKDLTNRIKIIKDTSQKEPLREIQIENTLKPKEEKAVVDKEIFIKNASSNSNTSRLQEDVKKTKNESNSPIFGEQKPNNLGVSSLKVENSEGVTAKGENIVLNLTNVERLHQQLRELSGRMVLYTHQGKKELELELVPPQLGKVKIIMNLENGNLKAEFITSSKEAFIFFKEQLPNIISNLTAMGVNITDANVYMNLNSESQNGNENLYKENKNERNTIKNVEPKPINNAFFEYIFADSYISGINIKV